MTYEEAGMWMLLVDMKVFEEAETCGYVSGTDIEVYRRLGACGRMVYLVTGSRNWYLDPPFDADVDQAEPRAGWQDEASVEAPPWKSSSTPDDRQPRPSCKQVHERGHSKPSRMRSRSRSSFVRHCDHQKRHRRR